MFEKLGTGLHGAEFLQLRGSVTAYAYNLQSQDRFEARKLGAVKNVSFTTWPLCEYLDLETRMSLRAALNSWTIGKAATLMAIAAFRRLGFFFSGGTQCIIEQMYACYVIWFQCFTAQVEDVASFWTWMQSLPQLLDDHPGM